MNKSRHVDQRDCLSDCLLHPVIWKCWMGPLNMWTLDSIQRIRSGYCPHLHHSTADCPCQALSCVWKLSMVDAISVRERKVIYRQAEKSTKPLHTAHEDPTVPICVQQQHQRVWVCRTTFNHSWPAYKYEPSLVWYLKRWPPYHCEYKTEDSPHENRRMSSSWWKFRFPNQVKCFWTQTGVCVCVCVRSLQINPRAHNKTSNAPCAF